MDQTGLTFVQVGRSAVDVPAAHPAAAGGELTAAAGARGREGVHGALRKDLASIREVLKSLFWMEQMNAGYGDVFFAPPAVPLTGTLCQYDKLHLHMADECTRDSTHF